MMNLSRFVQVSLATVLLVPIFASPLSEIQVDLASQIDCGFPNIIIDALRFFPASLLDIQIVTKSENITVGGEATITTTTNVFSAITIQPNVTSTTTFVTTISACNSTAPRFRREEQPSPPAYTPPAYETPTSTEDRSCTTLTPLIDTDLTKLCQCLSLPTSSTTVVSTVTEDATTTITGYVVTTTTNRATSAIAHTVTSTKTVGGCTAPTLCSNQGLEWAYYNNTSGDNDSHGYNSFKPEDYKNHNAQYEGVTSIIGGINVTDGEPQSIYGSSPLATRYFVLNHRGYIYARETGVYNFTISGADDAAFLWVGPNAQLGWTGGNSNAKAAFTNQSGVAIYTTALEEGKYHPVRILFAQGQGAAIFQLTVTAPDGTVFLSSSTKDSPFLVRFSCDGRTASKYGPFGSEV